VTDHSDDERHALALLSPLAGEPVGPARIDVARAMREGRRRRTSRWWAGATAVVAVTATTAAGGTLAMAALDRPSPKPARPAPAPSITVAAPPVGPEDCTVTRLPTNGVKKALVTAGDPTGRWLTGRTYPGNTGPSRPLIVWKDGKIAANPKVSGGDQRLQDINSHGVAVGSSWDPDQIPILYAGSKVTTLSGGDGEASALNDAGVIVGVLGDLDGRRPVRWTSATAQPGRLPLPARVLWGEALDIDEEGNVLGRVGAARQIGTGYLWLADGKVRRMPLPKDGDRQSTEFWPEAIRNGWVVGRATFDVEGGTTFEYYRYSLATGRYEQLAPEGGQPAKVAANGWMLGETGPKIMITSDAGRITVLPGYGKATTDDAYMPSSLSDDGRIAAGYKSGPGTENQPLLWRCS
jgi:hypothetical protein